MERKLNNKGLTLVELVIAVAMSTIVIGAATMFLYNAEKTYRRAEYSVDLQMEGQILMEQLGNWVMESNYILLSSDKKVLVLYNIPRDNNVDQSALYPDAYVSAGLKSNKATKRVIFVKDNKLYMKKVPDITDAKGDIQSILHPVSGSPVFYTDADVVAENCIGEYVGEVTLTDMVKADDGTVLSVNISLSMKEGTQSYALNDTFSLRNGAFGNATSPSPSPSPVPGG